MTFKDVAIKNFRFNIKKYFAYFLCSSFSITILFMYSTLLFNDGIVKEVGQTFLYNMMKTCLIIIGVFCFFFISYTHSSFMKYRSKEFGLFLTLGMTKKDISKIIKIENSIIILVSLIFGLLFGSVFSRLFFMIAIKILEFKNISYALNYKSYVLTTGLFLLIYIVVMSIIRIYINKMEILELLKNHRKFENRKSNHPILGIAGLVLIVVSFFLTHYTIKGEIFKDKQYMVAVYICILGIGLYFIISEFGDLSIKLCKKNMEVYLNKIVSLNQINYKFNQYKKILYTVSILSGAAIFFIGITFGIYATTKDAVMKEQPYDIMYVETQSKNKISEKELKKIIRSKKNSLREMKKVDSIQMELYKDYKYDGKYVLWNYNIILCENEANKILKNTVKVEKGKYIAACCRKKRNPWTRKGEIIKIKHKQGNDIYQFKQQEEVYEAILNFIVADKYDTLTFIILNNEDYKNIVNESSDIKTLTFHLLNFKYWRNTEANFNNLIERLKESNGISKDKNVWKLPFVANKRLPYIENLRPISKLEVYNNKMKENGFTFFIMSFIGILFFLSSGVVLYFKMYTDIDDEKVRYKKLFKIGITDAEMKKSISRELKPIFFLPLIFGSAIGIAYICIIFVNYSMYKKLLLVSIIVTLIYFMLHTIFYFITKTKYLTEILE